LKRKFAEIIKKFPINSERTYSEAKQEWIVAQEAEGGDRNMESSTSSTDSDEVKWIDDMVSQTHLVDHDIHPPRYR
jgi:hypothetical protein